MNQRMKAFYHVFHITYESTLILLCIVSIQFAFITASDDRSQESDTT